MAHDGDPATSEGIGVETNERRADGEAPLHHPAAEPPLDVVAIARARQDGQVELLDEQIELALDALIACRLAGTSDDLEATRLLLAELYDAGIATKAQVHERGKLELGEFFDYLRAYRLQAAASRG